MPLSEPLQILAVMLFGSCARGDNEANSDIDLLVVTSGNVIKHSRIDTVMAPLSLSYYPYKYIVIGAQEGDLFICHVVKEAKSLYDPHGILNTLRGVFNLGNRIKQKNKRHQN